MKIQKQYEKIREYVFFKYVNFIIVFFKESDLGKILGKDLKIIMNMFKGFKEDIDKLSNGFKKSIKIF